MKYDSGFTPVPQDYSTQQRQGIVDGLNDRIDNEEKHLEEHQNKYNSIVVDYDKTYEEKKKTARIAYQQRSIRDLNLFQCGQANNLIKDILWRQQQRINQETAKYSAPEMRSMRDKVEENIRAEFSQQLTSARAYSLELFGQYTTQKDITSLAEQSSTTASFSHIGVSNDIFVELGTIRDINYDIGKMKQQRGFFEGMA